MDNINHLVRFDAPVPSGPVLVLPYRLRRRGEFPQLAEVKTLEVPLLRSSADLLRSAAALAAMVAASGEGYRLPAFDEEPEAGQLVKSWRRRLAQPAHPWAPRRPRPDRRVLAPASARRPVCRRPKHRKRR